jgi:hypothetical protein
MNHVSLQNRTVESFNKEVDQQTMAERLMLIERRQRRSEKAKKAYETRRKNLERKRDIV